MNTNKSNLVSAIILLFLFMQYASAQQKPLLIPAGKFVMGCSQGDEICDQDEGPKGGIEVFVPSFYIFPHETSVAEYQLCVDSGNCELPFDYKRIHYCNYGAPGRDNYPVNCVNWNNAQSYCKWQGGDCPLKPNGKRPRDPEAMIPIPGVLNRPVVTIL